MARSTGCGLCSGSPDAPEFYLVVTYGDGKLLHLDYSRGIDGGAHVSFAPGFPLLLKAEATDVFAKFAAYAEGEDGEDPIRVHAATTAALAPADWAAVQDVLGSALPRVRAPTGEVSCVDGGAVVLEALSNQAHRRASWSCGEDPGEAWQRVSQQMRILEDWMAAQGSTS